MFEHSPLRDALATPARLCSVFKQGLASQAISRFVLPGRGSAILKFVDYGQLDLFDRHEPVDHLGVRAVAPADQGIFASFVLAGFECGHLGWNGHDLLATTRHLPNDRMAQHLSIVAAHGLKAARDGLPWRHDPVERIRTAARAGVETIWDLNHYDPPPDDRDHARRAAQAADRSQTFWICPVNEPMLYPTLAGMSWEGAVDLAILMAKIAKDHHPDVRVLTTDPITGIGERQFAATDRLVDAGLVDVVGVNYYPHTARTSLLKVLLKTWKRYRKPILVSETSFHDGHRVHHQRHPGFNKGAWFAHMRSEIAVAELLGVNMAGLCWYPVVDCPPWNRPRSRWSHGLIKSDLSVDLALSEALLDANTSGRVDLKPDE